MLWNKDVEELLRCQIQSNIIYIRGSEFREIQTHNYKIRQTASTDMKPSELRLALDQLVVTLFP